MITVHVVNERDGKPAQGADIRVAYYNPLPCHQTGRTNGSGDAHFTIEPCKGSIHVNGKQSFEGWLSGRIVVYK